MSARLPLTSTTMYLLADGTFSTDPNSGGNAVTVYVTDLLCVDDLDPNGGETTSDLQAFAQDIYHLLLELPNSNPDDPNGGIGVASYLSGPTTKLAVLPQIVDSQLRKDSRTSSSSTTLTQNQADGSFLLQVSIVPVGSLVPVPMSFKYQADTGLVPVNP